ncbi:hypothetical protein EMIHUDRAFT_194051 [Emiliania huxleyi CCMP1516]|uniref:Uncharacterized protein n=2 Tax=Emiliania huxleyi TaxID=2903 RepID=A0A0D3L0V9_EMIH1|nr:hypothetical protein EMIHUDRAFT_194051 [Emiliania huxleyi CCMP1516]EOD41644.1 hypothetical protein EMIHUDRAFT_194051 [Emiliania huxleyi CCMP1516]|eukprot:XP_005794073.1 hypothetical protein EMIHUDRAFT_194051 [Emiliania huxleyi CCMP1516]
MGSLPRGDVSALSALCSIRLLLGEKLARVEAPLSELARVEAPLSEEDALIMARLRREGASPGEPWRLSP